MLDSFGITATDLLGEGGEAQVYALDDWRVLRVYRPGAAPDYLAGRMALYEALRAQEPPFELPQVLDAGVRDGRHYCVEQRMRGRDFAQVLPALEGERRERALASYVDVAWQVGRLRPPHGPFGELLMRDPLRRDRWPEFVWERSMRTLAATRADLQADVPRLDAALAKLHAGLGLVAELERPGLVHGDYFPGNVFIDDDLVVCEVGDFSYTTLAGDGRMDMAGAISYLGVLPDAHPADRAFLRALVAEHHGAHMPAILDLYELYYAIYFSFCKGSDQTTYDWCVRTLNAHADAR